MKLEKAIEVLTAVSKSDYPQWIKGSRDAEKLGIEALKREVRNRRFKAHIDHSLLPGETKD